MKVNIVLAVCALAIAGLIAYGFYAAGADTLLIVFTAVLCLAELMFAMALAFPQRPRGTALSRTIAGLGFVITLGVNIIFAWTDVSTPVLVIINGLFAVLLLLSIYMIVRSDQ